MPNAPSTEDQLDDALLDRIIDHQVLVAWLGEDPRMKWWRADATDLEGGGDFFARWLPSSGQFAAIDAARRAAAIVDERMRAAAVSSEDQDELLTLFHLGSVVDRQVEDRFRYRRAQKTLGTRTGPFDAGALARELAVLGSAPPVEPTPSGRRIRRRATPLDAARVDALVLALFDGAALPPRYPMPHFDRRVSE